MAAKRRGAGKGRTFAAAVAVLTAMMLALPAAAFALPSETPDDTPEVEGRVRAIEQVGTNVWLGGRFTQVTQCNGGSAGDVGNVVVFDAQTDRCTDIAPNLGGTETEVWDIAPYGGTNNLLIAGKFPGPSATEKNLVLVNGETGAEIRWFNSASLKSVMAAPNVEGGRVYAGGVSLSAFDFASGNKLWTKSRTIVDPTIRPGRETSPAYRDLELDPNGQTIWAACICDEVDSNSAKAPAKALIKLDTEGNHVTSWLTEAGEGAFGQAVVLREGKLYLGAGGSDFVAQYGKNNGGTQGWTRDTSGSTQALTIMGNQLVVGGHFFAVGDNPGDKCGKGRPPDPDLNLRDCKRRQGIAAYSFTGVLDPNWDPRYSGSYSLVWALHVEGTRLHTGGEFKTVNGIDQDSYARFS